MTASKGKWLENHQNNCNASKKLLLAGLGGHQTEGSSQKRVAFVFCGFRVRG